MADDVVQVVDGQVLGVGGQVAAKEVCCCTTATTTTTTTTTTTLPFCGGCCPAYATRVNVLLTFVSSGGCDPPANCHVFSQTWSFEAFRSDISATTCTWYPVDVGIEFGPCVITGSNSSKLAWSLNCNDADIPNRYRFLFQVNTWANTFCSPIGTPAGTLWGGATWGTYRWVPDALVSCVGGKPVFTMAGIAVLCRYSGVNCSAGTLSISVW